MNMQKSDKIYISGHAGLVGSAIIRKLRAEGYNNIITKLHTLLDLTQQMEVDNFFKNNKPDYVFLCAGKVGGIYSNNTYRGQFIYENLMIQANIIHCAYKYKVKKLLALGSSCIYPKNCTQPIKEEYLLSGYLEETNEPYAIAKIAGLGMCNAYNKQYGCDFISAMPTNLYGQGDNYDLQNSHVLPVLIRKFHEAKAENKPYVEIWGTGQPLREFLYVDDLADAMLFLMQNYDSSDIINIGSGEEIAIVELVSLISDIIGYKGDIKFNSDYPDGTPRKLLDCSKINQLGWKANTNLKEGIKETYKYYLQST